MGTWPGGQRGSRGWGQLARPEVLYFLYYMAWGALFPFLNLHYRRVGLTNIQIGALSSLLVPIGVLGSLVGSAVADARGRERQVLAWSTALGMLAAALLSRAREYGAIIGWASLYTLVASPLGPLLDSRAVRAADRSETSFGTMRAWGTVGWAVSALIMGELVRRFGLRLAFYGLISLMAMALGACQLAKPGTSIGKRQSLWHGMRKLAGQAPFLTFLGGAFVLGTTFAAGNTFLSIFLDGLGANEALIGMAWTVGALTEIPVMLWGKKLIGWLGATGMVKAAYVALAVRWLALSFARTPAAAVALQSIHGVSFALFLVGGVTYVASVAPPGHATVAIAVFNLVAFSASSVAGSVVGGWLLDAFGGAGLFRALAGAAALGLLVLYAVRLRSKKERR